MRKLTMLWAAGLGLLSVALVAAQLRAAADDAMNAKINGVADLIQKGDMDGAKKAAKAIADKDDVEEIMATMRLRKKKGIGIGAPGLVKEEEDGIEKKVINIATKGITPEALKKESEALTRTGYTICAVALATHGKAPEKDAGKQKKADWVTWSEDLVKGAGEFANAAKGNNAGDLKKAANKVQQSCDSCHAVFR